MYKLICHPETPCGAVAAIEVEVCADADGVRLTYRLEGRMADIILPDVGGGARRDELWRTTCFEAFVAGAGAAYREFNFAPGGDYAVYDFDAYRDGMRAADVRPVIETVRDRDWFELAAILSPFVLSLSKGGLFSRGQDDASTSSARTGGGVVAVLGLSAVIEATDGTKSYWALAHAPGPPDFHNRDCFTATLPALERL